MKSKKAVYCSLIIMTILTFALIPLNILAVNFSRWIVVLMGTLDIIVLILYLKYINAGYVTKIIISIIILLAAAICSFVALNIPYWNSYSFKSYPGEVLDYDDVITYEQAKNDVDQVMSLLNRIHPMFADGLDENIQARFYSV